jgi:uncharacterized protein (DUF1778 family)
VARQSFSEIARAQTVKAGAICVMRQVLDKMTKEEQTEVIQALENPDIPGSAITRALKVWGHDIGSSSVYRHRRKECSCDHS